MLGFSKISNFGPWCLHVVGHDKKVHMSVKHAAYLYDHDQVFRGLVIDTLLSSSKHSPEDGFGLLPKITYEVHQYL